MIKIDFNAFWKGMMNIFTYIIHGEKKNFIIRIFAFFPLLSCGILTAELHWNWNKINLTNISFPYEFLWGCAESAMQTEGRVSSREKMIENSWTDFEAQLIKENKEIIRVGAACERWTRYKDDVQLLKKLGMNAHRFSIEWSKIEPKEGMWNEEAMQHYCDFVDELIRNDIVPVPTLFHHTLPSWFSKKKGFEKPGNSYYFIRFALYVFKHLHDKVTMWLILNEPVAYAIEGYYRGNYPPGQKSLKLAGKIALNLLNTHVAVAKEFKSIDNTAQIGIAHIMHPLDAYHGWNPLEKLGAKIFDYLINNSTINFFKTGIFKWIYFVKEKNPDAPASLDFFGINYYTHTTIKQTSPFKIQPEQRPEEKKLDQPHGDKLAKVLYPEGLYRMIRRVSKLKIPIYITENGTATRDPELRDEYLKKHLYTIWRARQDGYDVRGYFLWTLVDCFCWRKGYQDKYGIYAVDFTTQERTYRPSYDYLINTIKKNRNLT